MRNKIPGYVAVLTLWWHKSTTADAQCDAKNIIHELKSLPRTCKLMGRQALNCRSLAEYTRHLIWHQSVNIHRLVNLKFYKKWVMHSISPGTVNCSFHTHDKNAHYSTHGATAFTEIDNDNFSLLHKPHPPKGLEGRGGGVTLKSQAS